MRLLSTIILFSCVTGMAASRETLLPKIPIPPDYEKSCKTSGVFHKVRGREFYGAMNAAVEATFTKPLPKGADRCRMVYFVPDPKQPKSIPFVAFVQNADSKKKGPIFTIVFRQTPEIGKKYVVVDDKSPDLEIVYSDESKKDVYTCHAGEVTVASLYPKLELTYDATIQVVGSRAAFGQFAGTVKADFSKEYKKN